MSLGSGGGRSVRLWRCCLLSVPLGEQASGRRWDCSGLGHVARRYNEVLEARSTRDGDTDNEDNSSFVRLFKPDKDKIIITLRRAQKFGDTEPYTNFEFFIIHQCLSFSAILAEIYCPLLGTLDTNGLNVKRPYYSSYSGNIQRPYVFGNKLNFFNKSGLQFSHINFVQPFNPILQEEICLLVIIFFTPTKFLYDHWSLAFVRSIFRGHIPWRASIDRLTVFNRRPCFTFFTRKPAQFAFCMAWDS